MESGRFSAYEQIFWRDSNKQELGGGVAGARVSS
jgi:hypothetical protein